MATWSGSGRSDEEGFSAMRDSLSDHYRRTRRFTHAAKNWLGFPGRTIPLAYIPTVVMSADSGRHQLESIAADLTKPVDVDRLLEIVEAHCAAA